MKFSEVVGVLTFAATVAAQTPQDFPIVTANRLDVYYEGSRLNLTNSPGSLERRSDILTAPDVYRPYGNSDKLFVVIMIDQDVPVNNQRVERLHWLQPNLVPSDNGNLTVDVTTDGASSAVGAEYQPPTPPQGDIAHRYTFLLFTQPSMWTIPTNYSTINPPASSSARNGFDLVDFVGASGLGSPLAGAYMRVLNGTAEATQSASMATGDAAPAATATASGASGSASASASGNAAPAAMEPANFARELVMGVALAFVGAGAWML